VDPFWDAFVFRVFAGLGEDCFIPGFAAAADVLEAAADAELLGVADLNDLSVLLILLTCPPTSRLHRAAAQRYRDRSPTPFEDWAALREALPPRLTELLLVGHFGEPSRRALAHRAVHTLFVPSLVRFAARLALVDTHLAQGFVIPFVSRVLATLDYDQIVSDGFVARLYGRVHETAWPNAASWPEQLPAWHRDLTPAERLFLDTALDLDPGRRLLLYSSFYAPLNPNQLAEVLRPDLPTIRPDDVVSWLSQCWHSVLEGMASAFPGP
jgi:hypothetical protein